MNEVEIIGFRPNSEAKIPLFNMSVSAGLPTQAESYIDKFVDLNELLIEHPNATFFAKVLSANLSFDEIASDDILVIDTFLEPQDGNILMLEVDNAFVIKQLRILDGEKLLVDNNKFIPMNIEPYIQFNIIGVVTKIIHSFK